MVFQGIQILRALAANGVLASHLLTVEGKYGHAEPLLPNWAHFGAVGVDLFFVISGFIMVTIAGKLSWRRFLYARITRIYPAYWVYTLLVFGAALVMPAAVNASFEHAPSLWRSVFLVPDTVKPLLAVGWTLVHEMYFYVVFAAILALGVAQRWALAAWACVVVLAGLFFAAESYRAVQPIASTLFHPLTLEFIMGGLIGHAVMGGYVRFPRASLCLGLVGWVAAMITADDLKSLVDVADWEHVLKMGIPSALIVYGAVAFEKARGSFGRSWLVLLGDASYSIYLSHILVLSLVGRILTRMTLQGAVFEGLLIVLCVAGGNLFGLLSYRFMERPLMGLSRKALSKYVSWKSKALTPINESR